MGVKGLMTYVTNNKMNFDNVKLRHTSIVIDGNNIVFSLYMHHNIAYLYGGEYDKLAKAIVKFFDNLIKCDINPVVVLDGCYNLQESKLYTILSRLKDRLNSCKLINKCRYFGRIFPMLMTETLVSVLNKMNIKYLTCYGEADREIAALANELNCPVLSNDSDFFIYPLNNGFIPINSVSFKPAKEACDCCADNAHFFITCSMYNCERLHIKGVSVLKPNLLPLFASIAGNDFVDTGLLNEFYGQLNIKKAKNTKLNCLLSWLMLNFDFEEEALGKIIEMSPKASRDYLNNKLKDSILQYNISKSIIDMDNIKLILNNLPENLLLYMRQYIICPSLLNGFVSGKVFLITNVENITMPTVHNFSADLRYLFYRTIMSYFTNFKNLIEYSRKGDVIHKLVISRSDLEGIETDVLADYLGVKLTDNYIKMFISIWLNKLNREKFNDAQILSVIISVLISYSWYWALEQTDEERNFRKEQHSHPIHKYFVERVLKCDQLLNLTVIHAFNGLQSVYFTFNQLLSVIGADLSVIPPPQSLFCGRVCYSLYEDIQKPKKNGCSRAKEIINQIFSVYPCDNVKQLFNDIVAPLNILY